MDFTWDINPRSGDVDTQHVFYYRQPNNIPEVLPYTMENYRYIYTNIENPLHAIAVYNPVFTTISNILGSWSYAIPAMSRHMLSSYYYDNTRQLLNTYTLDSMGKYPIKQVQYYPYSNDTVVYIFRYRNAE